MKRDQSARRLFESVSAIYLILMMTVFLLWPGTAGYISISSSKFTLFLIFCGGYAGLMILLHVEETLIGGMKLPSPRKLWTESSWTQRLVMLYLLLTLEKPTIIKQSGGFGVRMCASAQSMHFIRAEIRTELNPIDLFFCLP